MTRAAIDWPARESAVLSAVERLMSAGTQTFVKATQLYRALGLDPTTTVREASVAALLPDERSVLSTLNRLEARGALVRARAGRGSRPTKRRVYVLPRGVEGQG